MAVNPTLICVFNPISNLIDITTAIDGVNSPSLGPASAGAPVVLNPDGVIDPSLVSAEALSGTVQISQGGTGRTTGAAALINLIGGSPTVGQSLSFNGTAWVPSSIVGLPSGAPNLVAATNPSGATVAVAALRSLVAADIPALPQSGIIGLPTVLLSFVPKASPTFTGTAVFANLTINGWIKDGTSSVGINGQVLSSTSTGVRWVSVGGTGTVTAVSGGGIAQGTVTTIGTITVEGSGNTLTAATAATNLGSAPSGDVITADGSGNIKDSGVLLTTLASLASPSFTGTAVFTNLSISGTLKDQISSVGTNGQVLSSTATGVKWVSGVPGGVNWNAIGAPIASLGTSISPLAMGTNQSYFAFGDYGATPAFPGCFYFTDVATSTTDISPNAVFDTGPSSRHNALLAKIQGVIELQVSWMTGPEGVVTVGGSALTPAQLTLSPFAKFVVMSLTGAHTVTRLYQQSATASGIMLELNNVSVYNGSTAPFYFLKAQSGCSATNSGLGTGSTIFSVRGDGLVTAPALALTGTLIDGTSSVGTSGQVLSSTGTGVAWVTSSSGGGGGFDIVGEVPTGTINGTNTVFTLAHIPAVNSEAPYVDGLRMVRGALNDYTISGSTITFVVPPEVDVCVDYGAAQIVGEIPTGVINGVNTVFALANAPITNTEAVYVGGTRMIRGVGNDYTISSNTITFVTASTPTTGESLCVDYA